MNHWLTMNRCTRRVVVVFLAVVQYLMVAATVMLLACNMAVAQAQDSIVFEFGAAPLRLIWLDSGAVANEGYGRGFGSLGDLFGTGRTAWAVGNGRFWQVYVADTITAYGFVSAATRKLVVAGDGIRPITGDFWGTGRKALCLSRTDSSGTRYCFFRVASDTLPQHPTATIDPSRLTPSHGLTSSEAIAADLDGDGDDELILRAAGLVSGNTRDTHGQLWIYPGGPDFVTDSPAVILRDPRPSLEFGEVRPREGRPREGTRASLVASDLDGDGHTDLATVTHHKDGVQALRFYWGTGSLSGYGDAINQREVIFSGAGPNAAWGITRLDCDGDSVADLLLGGTYRSGSAPLLAGPSSFLFRSGKGTSARSRSYRQEDADLIRPDAPESFNAGPLNDATGRYDMLLVKRDRLHLLYSGGPHGPDNIAEAYLRMPNDSTLSFTRGDDINGNGLTELMMADPLYGGVGLVAIYERGAIIPPPTHVNALELPIGMVLWPNPASHHVNILWRRTLAPMPCRFVVHDVKGAEVARAEIPPRAGSAFWYCRGVAAGVYLVSLYAADGSLLATARVIKEGDQP